MERRKFQRVPLKLEVEASNGSCHLMARETSDLSMQGLFLMTETPFPQGTDCEVVLLLRGLSHPLEVRLKAEVIRVTPDGMGICFRAVENLESYHHLRNLVLYNSPDPDGALDEILESVALDS